MGAKIDSVSHGLDFSISMTAFGISLTAFVANHRQKLWYKGGIEGWNSSPSERIHCDLPGNCHELPEPLVWSQQLTQATLAIALLSLILFITRIVLRISGQLSRTVSIIYDSILSFFWVRVLLSQASGDLSDPRHPSTWPWYLTRTCPTDTAAACITTQAGFAISVLATVFYGGRLMASAVGIAGLSFKPKEDGYRSVALIPNLFDQENGLCPDCAAALEKERYRYHYGEALSPVLAFFPNDEYLVAREASSIFST
ncbi:hypothetical protein KVR01_012162 [Diaporthe batatas]|uniref:uncharacterized protein n=1 Tax=Diaporthe batatas TaxID=748121 RepID=UPI001D054FD3|nr:uncharacterized protein KVR01_012162 [Diaporthe batatas]KAG8157890.1 hypothetical protein KVR01_012162 [Diaporthe batatas]